MASYTELNNRPASAFLDASAFRTGWDTDAERAKEAYRKASEEMKGYKAFHVGAGGVWCADCKDGSFLSSCEGIGYHAYTAELLQAALDADCEFYVYRYAATGSCATVKFDIRAMQAGRDGRME